MNDEYYMRIALNEAEDAYSEGEVPVGAIIVCNDKIIGRAHNLTETLNDVTAHAEMLAITAAQNTLGAKYLRNSTLYVTLEPCLMCAGAIAYAQIMRIVYAASDPKKGYSTYLKTFPSNIHIESGILSDEASKLLRDFFYERRH